jgi:hypothetical protein
MRRQRPCASCRSECRHRIPPFCLLRLHWPFEAIRFAWFNIIVACKFSTTQSLTTTVNIAAARKEDRSITAKLGMARGGEFSEDRRESWQNLHTLCDWQQFPLQQMSRSTWAHPGSGATAERAITTLP